MSAPNTPERFLKEGPASPCRLHGNDLKWKNCTCLSCAMGMNKSSIGAIDMSGCAVREETGDFTGGTMLSQMRTVAASHGIATELHVGSKVCSLWYAAYQNDRGRGFELQGNEIVTKGKNVNHDVWVNNPVGGTAGDPDGFMVWDTDSNGPEYWSYAKTKAFAMALRPYGESDHRTLGNMGIAGVYCLIYPDTEPHVHLKYGASKTSRFPDKTRIDRPGGQWAYKSPAYGAKNRARRYADGDAFLTYQRVSKGGRWWRGSHTGTLWIPEANLRELGGAT